MNNRFKIALCALLLGASPLTFAAEPVRPEGQPAVLPMEGAAQDVEKDSKAEAAAKAKEENNCPICLNDLGDKPKGEYSWCPQGGHQFHKTCLNRWLSQPQNRTCPICKQILSLLPSPAAPGDPVPAAAAGVDVNQAIAVANDALQRAIEANFIPDAQVLHAQNAALIQERDRQKLETALYKYVLPLIGLGWAGLTKLEQATGSRLLEGTNTLLHMAIPMGYFLASLHVYHKNWTMPVKAKFKSMVATFSVINYLNIIERLVTGDKYATPFKEILKTEALALIGITAFVKGFETLCDNFSAMPPAQQRRALKKLAKIAAVVGAATWVLKKYRAARA
jgi:hypothetical protein